MGWPWTHSTTQRPPAGTPLRPAASETPRPSWPFDSRPRKLPLRSGQAPLQPVGEASLKKEGKESKEPQEPQDPQEPKEPKEYGNPPSESQATEAKTVAETKDAGGSSTLHSGGTTNGVDQSGKEAEPEAEMPSMAADECPDLGLEMASSGELGHATPLTGDAESEDRLAIARTPAQRKRFSGVSLDDVDSWSGDERGGPGYVSEHRGISG